MERLASGDAAALDDLMERHARKLFNYLVRCLQNEEDTADAAQETFVRVYQNREKFDVSRRFSTWLFAIATNLVKDRYRSRTRHPHVSLEEKHDEAGGYLRESLADQKPLPNEILEAQERAEFVQKAVAALPEELRMPLLLSEYEELPHAEIGAILNYSPKAVEARLYRARKRLRKMLGPLLKLS